MDWKLFERICNAPGIPGHEDAVQEVVAEVLGRCCNSLHRDRMGNVIGLKKAARHAGRTRGLATLRFDNIAGGPLGIIARSFAGARQLRPQFLDLLLQSFLFLLQFSQFLLQFVVLSLQASDLLFRLSLAC